MNNLKVYFLDIYRFFLRVVLGLARHECRPIMLLDYVVPRFWYLGPAQKYFVSRWPKTLAQSTMGPGCAGPAWPNFYL